MLRTVNVVPRNQRYVPQAPVAIAAGKAVDVFPDTTIGPPDEIVCLEVFNPGPNDCTVAIGTDATANMWNYKLAAGVPCTILSRQRVSVYSAGGTTVGLNLVIRTNHIDNKQ